MALVDPQLLAVFGCKGATVQALGGGLINETFAVEHQGGEWILQRVNPIFSPRIHDSIEAVGRQLRGAGITSPRLKRVEPDQGLFAQHGDAVWRMLERIDGYTLDRAQSTGQLEAAGGFVARWHNALEDFTHDFAGQRRGVHDTPAHLDALRAALDEHADHRLYKVVRPLAEQIFAALQSLPPIGSAQLAVAHGDLKLNNLLFAKPSGPANAQPPSDSLTAPAQVRCLIDLDTMGPMFAAYELGDALRSWCNRAGEDEIQAQLDLDFYAAASHAYLQLRPAQRRDALAHAMWVGADWISLELTARFLADALHERYFGFDAERFGSRGEHNLHRAQGQWSLHTQFARTREQRRTLIGGLS